MDFVVWNDLFGFFCWMICEKDWVSGCSVEILGDKFIGYVFKECVLKGYIGKDFIVFGCDLMCIFGFGGLKNGVSLRVGG